MLSGSTAVLVVCRQGDACVGTLFHRLVTAATAEAQLQRGRCADSGERWGVSVNKFGGFL